MRVEAVAAFGTQRLFPLCLLRRRHPAEHGSQLQRPSAAYAEYGDRIELGTDAERAAFSFFDPGPEAGRVVGMAAEGHDVALVFQADGAGLLRVDVVRKAVLYIVVLKAEGRSRLPFFPPVASGGLGSTPIDAYNASVNQ